MEKYIGVAFIIVVGVFIIYQKIIKGDDSFECDDDEFDEFDDFD